MDSDDEATAEETNVRKNDKSSKKPKQSPKKMVEVDLMGMFGSEPVKRKERPKSEKKSNESKSLVQAMMESSDDDLTIVLDDVEKAQKTEKIATPAKPREEKKRDSSSRKSDRIRASSRTPKKESSTPAKIKHEINLSSSEKSSDKPKTRSKRERTRSPPPALNKSSSSHDDSMKKSAKKEKNSNKVFTVEDDEARHERKQASIALFHKMKTRPSVLNHGCKKIPEGKPDCLKGCQFLISGVLESMEREEAATLIKSCGGVVSNGLSKKITHFLVGEEAGPAKLAKAETMGIRQISEDDLLDMIREKSGLKSKVKSEKKEIAKEDKVEKESKKTETKESPGKENKQENEVKNETKSPPKTPKYAKPVPVTSSTSSTMSLSAVPESKEIVFSLVDKYKPTNVKQIVGQQGNTGNATKLTNWLAKWEKNNDGTKKHVKPNPWAKDNDGSAFKAALLSGE